VPIIRTTNKTEAQALETKGARLLRYAHDRVLSLDHAPVDFRWQTPEFPSGLHLVSVQQGLVERIALASLIAYPPEHPDHAPGETVKVADAEQRYSDLVNGRRTGELIPEASGVLLDEANNEVVGVAVITDLEASSVWPGGPWVADVFIVPAWHGSGLGRRLLQRAIAASKALGHRRIGLTVTERQSRCAPIRAAGVHRFPVDIRLRR